MFPFFIVILFAVIEFAFALNALLAVNFATREGALAAAEAGNAGNADCSILRAVSQSIQAPTDQAKITSVRIFLAKADGSAVGPQVVYNQGGSLSCPLPDGTPATLPFTFAGGTYTAGNRCNVLAGCGTKTVDTIGVEMTYRYDWKTPLANLLPLPSGGGYTLKGSNAMRMEPVL